MAMRHGLTGHFEGVLMGVYISNTVFLIGSGTAKKRIGAKEHKAQGH